MDSFPHPKPRLKAAWDLDACACTFAQVPCHAVESKITSCLSSVTDIMTAQTMFISVPHQASVAACVLAVVVSRWGWLCSVHLCGHQCICKHEPKQPAVHRVAERGFYGPISQLLENFIREWELMSCTAHLRHWPPKREEQLTQEHLATLLARPDPGTSKD